jgi:hypothetical protein
MGPEPGEAVARQIQQRTWGRIRRLRVEWKDSRVVVQGCAPSYYVKQLALQAVRDLDEKVTVDLDIEVGESEFRMPEGRSRS